MVARSPRVRISLSPQRKKFSKENFNAAVAFKFEEFITRRHHHMFYYVYILQSQKDKSLYIGYTSNLKNRFKQHNSGESRATKPFLPYKLIFYEAFLNRIDAKNREEYLKSGYGRRTIKTLLKRFFPTPPLVL